MSIFLFSSFWIFDVFALNVKLGSHYSRTSLFTVYMFSIVVSFICRMSLYSFLMYVYDVVFLCPLFFSLIKSRACLYKKRGKKKMDPWPSLCLGKHERSEWTQCQFNRVAVASVLTSFAHIDRWITQSTHLKAILRHSSLGRREVLQPGTLRFP